MYCFSRITRLLSASALAVLGVASAIAQYTIGGVTYVETPTTETQNVTLLVPDGAVTANTYSNYVKLTVSGTGYSYADYEQDAFYIFDSRWFGGPYNSGGYWQFAMGTGELFANQWWTGAYQYIVYDIDAGVEVTQPYVPAYRQDHTYSVIVDVGALPNNLHFGVSDQIFADNGGEFVVTVTQLAAAPIITCNDPVVLWSPNHSFADVSSAFSVSTQDGSAVTYTVRVFSNEKETEATGSGTFAPDFKDEHDVANGRGVLVRAERSGSGVGRYYIGEITATTADGASATMRCVLAVVPKDSSQASLDFILAKAEAEIDTAPYQHGISGPIGSKQ